MLAKARFPLNSFRAKGMVGGCIVYRDFPSGYSRQTRVNIKGFQKKPTGEAQMVKEAGIKKCQAVWATLSVEEKASWEYVADGRPVPNGERVWRADLGAYHKFLSYAMRAYLAGRPIPRSADDLIGGIDV